MYLIDTPGFDDTNREDIETLKVIAHYLSVGYANRVHIGGVVFLHRISDNRMTGTMKRNIAMFKSLCGPDSLSNVAVATTMWPEDADLVSQRRRDQLLDTKEYFGDVCAEGARMFELRGVLGSHTLQESSLKVVSHLMDMHRLSPVILQIQHELVDQQLPLEDTQAGRVICEGLHRSQAELSDQLAELRKSMQNALERGDQESLHNLRQLRRDMQLDNERTEQNSQSLATSLTQMHEEELSRLMRRLDALEDQWQSTLKTKEAELEAARAQRLEALRRSSGRHFFAYLSVQAVPIDISRNPIAPKGRGTRRGNPQAKIDAIHRKGWQQQSSEVPRVWSRIWSREWLGKWWTRWYVELLFLNATKSQVFGR